MPKPKGRVEAGTQTEASFVTRPATERGVEVIEKSDKRVTFNREMWNPGENSFGPIWTEKEEGTPGDYSDPPTLPDRGGSLRKLRHVGFIEYVEGSSSETSTSDAEDLISVAPFLSVPHQYHTAQSLPEFQTEELLLRSLSSVPAKPSTINMWRESIENKGRLTSREFDKLAESVLERSRVSCQYIFQMIENMKLAGYIPPDQVPQLRDRITNDVLPGAFKQIPCKFIQLVFDTQ